MYIYICTHAWGPRFPQIILLIIFIIDPNVKNHCFATAKCGFCTLFLFILLWHLYGPKFLGPRKLHVMTCSPQYMSILIFMFSPRKYHFSWISLIFYPELSFFYCGSWGTMKRCHFLLVFAVNFNVSMKQHMLIVSPFLLVVASTSSPCCNMFFFKVSTGLHPKPCWRGASLT